MAEEKKTKAKTKTSKKTVVIENEVESAPEEVKVDVGVVKRRKRSSTKKKRASTKAKRVKATPLTLADVASEFATRDRWGCYLQFDPEHLMDPYGGKTNDLVRRTGEHRRLLCKQTRRFAGRLGPFVFVTRGFACERDALHYEWRLKHECKPSVKMRHAFGGPEARKARVAAVEAECLVEAECKPTAKLAKALRAIAVMLTLTRWTNSALPIDHESRKSVAPFKVYWFCPDPVCFGFDIKALATAYPVEHIFNVTLQSLPELLSE